MNEYWLTLLLLKNMKNDNFFVTEASQAPKMKRKVMERKFRISPATLRNELENNDVYHKSVSV